LGRQESAKDISWDVGFETPAGVTRGGSGNHDQVAQSYRETMTITPNAKVFSPLQRTAETKTVYAPLGKARRSSLAARQRARMSPDGRVYVTRCLICQE
jgi:hypothetical protein